MPFSVAVRRSSARLTDPALRARDAHSPACRSGASCGSPARLRRHPGHRSDEHRTCLRGPGRLVERLIELDLPFTLEGFPTDEPDPSCRTQKRGRALLLGNLRSRGRCNRRRGRGSRRRWSRGRGRGTGADCRDPPWIRSDFRPGRRTGSTGTAAGAKLRGSGIRHHALRRESGRELPIP